MPHKITIQIPPEATIHEIARSGTDWQHCIQQILLSMNFNISLMLTVYKVLLYILKNVFT
jgi:hypothetical protein